MECVNGLDFFELLRANVMPYNLDGLFAKTPTERLIVPYENPHFPVVFIARWPNSCFASHGEFIQLIEMYDSAMQGFIQGMTQEELSKWFCPHEDYDLWSVPGDPVPLRTEDSAQWLKRNFPFVHPPWLGAGDHTEIISETEGEFGDLIAWGRAGYLYVFVADQL